MTTRIGLLSVALSFLAQGALAPLPLAAEDDAWKRKDATRTNRVYNKNLGERFDYVSRSFRVQGDLAEP